jgi:hypothetical protein
LPGIPIASWRSWLSLDGAKRKFSTCGEDTISGADVNRKIGSARGFQVSWMTSAEKDLKKVKKRLDKRRANYYNGDQK